MSISSELEKLVALKDRGDLSEAEFEKAKALLLCEDYTGTQVGGARSNEEQSISRGHPETSMGASEDKSGLAELRKKCRTQFLTALLASLAALMSALSMMLNPSPLKGASMVIWVVVSVFMWPAYAKLKSEIEKWERGQTESA